MYYSDNIEYFEEDEKIEQEEISLSSLKNDALLKEVPFHLKITG